MNATRPGYRFGPIERRGLLGPFGLSQVLLVGVALVLAVVLLDALPSAGGAILGIGLTLAAAALATVPVAGRTPVAWIPLLGAFMGRGLRGQRRFLSPAATAGHRPGADGPVQVAALPRELAGVTLTSVPYRSGSLGAISDRGGRQLTALLACEVGAFGLLDPPAQERRLAAWGTILASSANTPVHRLQWIERAAPAEGDELARWLHTERDPELGERGSALMESYLELIESSAPVMHAHEVLLAIQVDAARIRGRKTAVGVALVEQTERIARAMETAEVKLLGALSSDQIAGTLRTGIDPFARPELAAQRSAGGRPRSEATRAGPVAQQEEWDHLRSDGALHATFWISGWPRVDVAPMFMSALLAPSATVRTIAVTFEPLAPERSTREVQAAITRDRADAELRHRFGQLDTARQRQSQEAALRREAELAAGHAEVRFSGFVTVSARDPDELRRACQDTIQQATMARLELRRLYGQQARAFTFTLPLARGLS